MKLQVLIQRLLFLSIKADGFDPARFSEDTKILLQLSNTKLPDVDIFKAKEWDKLDYWLEMNGLALEPIINDQMVVGISVKPS